MNMMGDRRNETDKIPSAFKGREIPLAFHGTASMAFSTVEKA